MHSLINGFNDKPLRVSLILCSFGRIIVMGFYAGACDLPTTGSWPENGARHGFHLVEQD